MQGTAPSPCWLGNRIGWAEGMDFARQAVRERLEAGMLLEWPREVEGAAPATQMRPTLRNSLRGVREAPPHPRRKGSQRIPVLHED